MHDHLHITYSPSLPRRALEDIGVGEVHPIDESKGPGLRFTDLYPE